MNVQIHPNFQFFNSCSSSNCNGYDLFFDLIIKNIKFVICIIIILNFTPYFSPSLCIFHLIPGEKSEHSNPEKYSISNNNIYRLVKGWPQGRLSCSPLHIDHLTAMQGLAATRLGGVRQVSLTSVPRTRRPRVRSSSMWFGSGPGHSIAGLGSAEAGGFYFFMMVLPLRFPR